MTKQATGRASTEKQVEVEEKRPTIVAAEPLFARMKEIYATIERRAYELFEGRGYQDGHDFEDWVRAEAELLCPVSIEIKESSDELTVLAKVAGFDAKDIQVSAEPQRLFISGKEESILEKSVIEGVYVEEEARQLFRVVDLSAEVDSSNVKAVLEDGILKITLPKSAIEKGTQALVAQDHLHGA